MKIKSLLILGLMTVCSIAANAATHHKVSGIWYKLGANSTATVAGVSDGMTAANAATITIPASFEDGDGNARTVTGFEANWQAVTADIGGSGENTQSVVDKVVTLNVAVTNFAAPLAKDAFDALTALKTLKVSGEYAKGDYAVAGPGGATVETLDLSTLTAKGDNAKITIAANAFSSNTVLKTISMPAQTTEIGGSAFQDATALEGIDLTNVTKIGLSAFKGCTNAKFTTLTIPANIAKDGIGNYAFEGVTALTSVTITNDNLEEIGAWFAGDAAIKTVSITAGAITKIAALAFEDSPIESLTISAAKLKTIGSKAFAGYVGTKINFLTDLTALEEVSDDTFPTNPYTSVKLAGTKLDDTNFANALAWLANADGTLKTFTLPGLITSITAAALKDFTKLEEIALTKNIETIGESAFEGCTALASITIPAKVTTIDKKAFYGCENLATVDLSGAEALEAIGEGAFDGCKVLATVAIPAKVTNIAKEAFNGCEKLATVDFSKAAALTSIGADAFAGTALTKIDLSGAKALTAGGVVNASFPTNIYTSIKLTGTLLADADMSAVKAWMAGVDGDKSTQTSLKEFTFPSAVTTIPDNFFKGFTALTTVGLPKECTTIGESAFEASGLTSFKVREKVATIGAKAFKDCADLATVNFSDATALTTINANAFQNTAVAKVSIPANANGADLTISEYAFAECAKLTSFAAVSWAGEIADNMFQNDVKLNGINVPVGISGIGDYAFDGCKSLATVNFKYDVKDDAMSAGSIGDYAFRNCEKLATLDLSTTQLTELDGDYTFWGCTSLATIIFPEELEKLGVTTPGMFADCPIEEFDASMVDESGVLFGMVKNKKETALEPRTAKTPNTTLKSVKIRGIVPEYCFAYCTALETVEYFSATAPADNNVKASAFAYCTGLKTFTYKPEEVINVENINEDAFIACTPYIHFDTNTGYTNNNPKAPLNCAYEGIINSDMTVKTVLSKAGGTEGIGKFYNAAIDVHFNANDCKIYTAYVDEETIYYQAGRTVDGYYNIPAGAAVIIKTTEPTEISFKEKFAPGTGTKESTSNWNDVYCSSEGDDLVSVQAGAGLEKGQYLYRFTNTAEYGFAFTLFTGSTVKAGQFFVASAKKPASGRLNEVWLDEDGNVEGATAIQGVKKVLDAKDGAIYNLNGVRVQNPTKGIYIQNGKKIAIK